MVPVAPSCYISAQKPLHLSDPGYDWDEETLVALLKKDKTDLDDSDFRCLFAAHLPAGSYEELRHYVPDYVRYMYEHTEKLLDMITDWSWFASANWTQIFLMAQADM